MEFDGCEGGSPCAEEPVDPRPVVGMEKITDGAVDQGFGQTAKDSFPRRIGIPNNAVAAGNAGQIAAKVKDAPKIDLLCMASILFGKGPPESRIVA